MNPILASLMAGLWLGEQTTLDAFVDLLKAESTVQLMAQPVRPAVMLSASGSGADDPYPDNSASYKRDGSTAVIGISGPLVNSSSWVLGFIGATGYPHIIERMQQAANDPEVTNVVLDMNTPGGSTNGITAASDAITAVNGIKPVNALVEGMALSAGYWLANAAGSITVSKMGMLGSVGVIQTHTEYSKADAQDGITRTVLRVGENKALASPHEPLSDKARAQQMGMMNHFYGGFMDQVAKGRNTTKADAEARFGGGDLFYGANAVKIGAADMLGTYSDVVANSKKMAENRGVSTNLRLSAEVTDMTIEELQAAVAAAQEAKATAETQLAELRAQVDGDAVTLKAAVDARAASDTALIDAKVELQATQGKLAEAQVQVEALSGIARGALASMNVALGQPAADLSALGGATLIARHAEVSATFTAKFPGGQVSHSSAEVEEETINKTGPDAAALALHQARLNAVIGAKGAKA